MMDLYPVFLKIKERECLVIGGGSVAERKVKTLEAKLNMTFENEAETAINKEEPKREFNAGFMNNTLNSSSTLETPNTLN